MAPPARQRLRRFVRIASISAAGLLVLALVVGGVGYLLISSAPPWWRTVNRAAPTTIEMARRLEDRVISRVTEARPAASAPDDAAMRAGVMGPPTPPPAWASELWTIDVPVAEANAWLNTRLPQWLSNRDGEFRWPRELSDFQVNFSDERIQLGVAVRHADGQHVLSATITPRLLRDGSFWAPAESVAVGRLSLPASWVIGTVAASDYVPDRVREMPEAAVLFHALDGMGPMVRNAVIRLEDGRRVRVLDVQPRRGSLRLVLRTERP